MSDDIERKGRGEDLRPPAAAPLLSMALQGGGSLGAFTWGVLDRLLEEERIAFDAVSGVSAGAVNAAVMAAGWAAAGASGAREHLERFWRRASGTSPSASMNHALAFSSRLFSPYRLNPFDLSPLRLLLQAAIDIDLIRRKPPFRLMVGATRVTDGTLRIFESAEMSLDVLMASACLPLLNQAIAIEGDDYWDGGYAANPPLLPLIEASRARDILVVKIIPDTGESHPRSASDIQRRLDHMAFSASLTRDLALLDTMRTLVGDHPAGSPGGKLLDCTVQVISAEDWLPDLTTADALDLDWTFLRDLRDAGRAAADGWLCSRRSIPEDAPTTSEGDYEPASPAAQSASRPWRYVG